MYILRLLLVLFLTSSCIYGTEDREPTFSRWMGWSIGAMAGCLVNISRTKVHPYAVFHERHDNPYHFDNAGFVGGLKLGGTYQIGHWIGGLETDFNYTSLQKKHSFHFHTPYDSTESLLDSLQQKIPWFGTLRPRIGVGYHEWLLYMSGGLAYGSIHSETVVLRENAWYTGSQKKIKMGWTLGGGFEHSFYTHWSFLVEYIFVDLGRLHYQDTRNTKETNTFYRTRQSAAFHCIRLGINYKL